MYDTGYGVFWFAGGWLMGYLCTHSVQALVIFSLSIQMISLPIFWVTYRPHTPKRVTCAPRQRASGRTGALAAEGDLTPDLVPLGDWSGGQHHVHLASGRSQWLAGQRDDATVLADPDRLVVALDAILDNAVRFTREGDPIELSVHRTSQDAAITIADSGPGIPDARLDTVFDRFNTPDPHRHTARNFGLGLSIVRAIASAHGGRATARPGTLGGAAVTLWLPLHEQEPSLTPVAGPQPAQTAVGPA